MIAPGVRAQSCFGAPDVMRGEETQVAGAMALCPQLRNDDWLLCLPGTHGKWVELSNGSIQTITTAVSGELFALLSERSTLCEGAPYWDGIENADFRRGLVRSGEVALLHALFEARARRLTGDLADSRAFLSGLIIGNDVRRASSGTVVLVGTEGLNALYVEALRHRGVDAVCLDGNRCSVAGLAMYLCHQA
jgi:2-dehydro-3-deoxygalactonokinase